MFETKHFLVEVTLPVCFSFNCKDPLQRLNLLKKNKTLRKISEKLVIKTTTTKFLQQIIFTK